jgi:putative membrane-bound dehydrogenase-like protein
MRHAFSVLALVLVAVVTGTSAEPRLLVDEPGFGLELVAREPDIVTPISMAFDTKGRLLVIESHTHQRPAGYEGPAGDRIRMFVDSDRDGRLDTWTTFAEGYQQAMGLCVRPDGGVYLATRRDVRLLEDTDGDGASDKETTILRLETEAEYPHNGMSGLAFKPHGDGSKGTLAIGIGENFGEPYKIIGSDGTELEMHDGSGRVYMCNADGSGLVLHATGFWNPFALCLAGKSLYCVDNDPDASPPCRLIQVMPGGDYGFRFQYGRAGVHPLLAWNGELPGTLGHICGTGEAPTAIVFHHGFLWVTSWGDHRIERYAPVHGGDLKHPERQARMQVVVQGEEDFRPTGCAIAPDGSLYFADWVSRSYPVHGQGRIWRLSLPQADQDRPPVEQVAVSSSFQKAWDSGDSTSALKRQAYIASGNAVPESLAAWGELTPEKRLVALESLRWKAADDSDSFLRAALADDDPDVRLFAVRWISDERLTVFRDDVAKLLDGPMPSERYFLCILAAIEWLDGDASPRTAGISDGLLRRELANESRSPELHALALRMISPDHDWLTIERLRGWLASESPALRLEAARTLVMQTKPERLAVLAEIAGDATYGGELRAEAVAGLAADVEGQGELLERLAGDGDQVVAGEAQRVLTLSRERRGEGDIGADAARPGADDLGAWTKSLAEGGDAAAGRRLFFMPGVGPQCAACHQHSGRGGRVGPDLTTIGRQQWRERVVASILQPSGEIAPHYQAWTLLTTDGLSRAGLKLPEGGDDGVEDYADPQGRKFSLKSEEIELRSPSDQSIMPEGLERTLSVDDLRDLVAFLMSERAAPAGGGR